MPHSAFHGFIPDDRLYCPRSEMWVQEIGEGEVRIGATAFGLFLAGEVIAFTAKPRGADVAIGRGMGTVESRKTVIAIHAPISFVQLEGNDAAEASPALVNRDPYGTGWMVRAQPTAWVAERPALLDGAAYRRHILTLDPEARFVD
ncbi:MAG: glycine cleavage system protein H [Azonexus sp.]|jgi:glycine cleavage system H protein|nr:glycine cleavage system protein H [Betaproteobacteria bacterium]MBK8919704.1 glycine cleavage system protein H [Betaproteobacteria bacterium]MBP6034949.1 glycine cleavage system protein H [Azonexus sp.]MBP6905655.1 glycine cleavage system protein H [Azonexus sp.]